MSPRLDAVFISDLHLNPCHPEITTRFLDFVQWALKATRSVYILGDFFHVWAGDDAQTEWTDVIAHQLSLLAMAGVSVYYLHGNRDFLLGHGFADRASMTILLDPTLIQLGGQSILLTHGDRYCTQDRGHQWLRRLTRNRLFTTLFLKIPLRFRKKIVQRVRMQSEANHHKPLWKMAIVPSVMLTHLQQMKARIVIHGHIHQPGLTQHDRSNQQYAQYVLSDWDDNPQILCYNKTKGFYFTSI